MITGTGAMSRMRRHTSVPAMPGQEHVQQDQVGGTGDEAPEAVGAVGGQLDLVALHGQARVQRLAVGLVVLDDEDAGPGRRLRGDRRVP